MPEAAVTLRGTDINHALMAQFTPNDWAAFETAALHRLQAQLPAAHVTACTVDVMATNHHNPIGLKFHVTSTAVLDAPAIKGALR
jgi:hypothetical protein